MKFFSAIATAVVFGISLTTTMPAEAEGEWEKVIGKWVKIIQVTPLQALHLKISRMDGAKVFYSLRFEIPGNSDHLSEMVHDCKTGTMTNLQTGKSFDVTSDLDSVTARFVCHEYSSNK